MPEAYVHMVAAEVHWSIGRPDDVCVKVFSKMRDKFLPGEEVSLGALYCAEPQPSPLGLISCHVSAKQKTWLGIAVVSQCALYHSVDTATPPN
eukprot:scaffold172509_cov19-Prasinocladus_malaysianus.AAC.1